MRQEGPGLAVLSRECPEKAPTYMVFYRQGPEKAPTYIGFYREGPEKAPSSTEKAPRRPRLTLVFTGKAPLTPFGFYKSKWRRIAFELEKLIMPRCVTCAIVSVVARVFLKRGGSGLCGMRWLALRKRGGMIEPLLASKNLCNLADVLKYPRSKADAFNLFANIV